ncbi:MULTISPECIES: DUF4402 domain-containing protein [Pseudoalteromonas]|uniref:DUF4402 domain-containing protein n=1 Tax=Pseudoalteromonas obscura TaxID=3048491 RepID=A0ABT7EI10_9GAMM|nr:DUF4402 domain-containing protein [Pseudoalteromonas sp. P94(2023)]MBQ4836340.1 DUF4402 domain-containing protein [Pseudoalteromonas luteoviolacea]MDK2594690.1 DUF4402 domain-containing protein [Pseudoalteromonas sp. P94(2023)]
MSLISVCKRPHAKGVQHAVWAGLLLLISYSASSRTEVITPLDFGTIVISDHTQVGRVQIGASGHNVTSGPVHLVSGGQAAELLFSSLPALHSVTVSTSIITPMLSHSNLYVQGINLVQLEHVDRLFSDAQGNALLKVGGTIEIGAQSTQYPDGTYRVWANIEVSY